MSNEPRAAEMVQAIRRNDRGEVMRKLRALREHQEAQRDHEAEAEALEAQAAVERQARSEAVGIVSDFRKRRFGR
jgi:hypothetical protein